MNLVCLFFSQEKVKAVFDNLIQLEHLNIVKFHKYWADVKENRARVRDCSKIAVINVKGVERHDFCVDLFAFISSAGHIHH